MGVRGTQEGSKGTGTARKANTLSCLTEKQQQKHQQTGPTSALHRFKGGKEPQYLKWILTFSAPHS